MNKEYIGLSIQHTAPGSDNLLWTIYYRRKDNPKDHSGYAAESKEKVGAIELKDLDKFKVMPKSWDEIEPMKLKGLYYAHS